MLKLTELSRKSALGNIFKESKLPELINRKMLKSSLRLDLAAVKNLVAVKSID